MVSSRRRRRYSRTYYGYGDSRSEEVTLPTLASLDMESILAGMRSMGVQTPVDMFSTEIDESDRYEPPTPFVSNGITYLKYKRNGVYVISKTVLIGKFNEIDLCQQCESYKPGDERFACEILSALESVTSESHISAPILECPSFSPRNGVQETTRVREPVVSDYFIVDE